MGERASFANLSNLVRRALTPLWRLWVGRQEALRSVIISQQLLGTREVVLFHHTDCGMLTFKDDVLRAKLKESVEPGVRDAVGPAVDQLSFLPFPDLGAFKGISSFSPCVSEGCS